MILETAITIAFNLDRDENRGPFILVYDVVFIYNVVFIVTLLKFFR